MGNIQSIGFFVVVVNQCVGIYSSKLYVTSPLLGSRQSTPEPNIVSSHANLLSHPAKSAGRGSIELLSQHPSYVSLFQNISLFNTYSISVPTGVSLPLYPGLVAGSGCTTRYNRAESACYDLILHSSANIAHWSNASSPFFFLIIYRRKAETGSSARLISGKMRFPIALRCGHPR
jgi:hypothetical protein